MKTPHRDPVSLSEHIYLTLFSLRICLVYSAVVIFVILFSHRVWSSSRCVDENCSSWVCSQPFPRIHYYATHGGGGAGGGGGRVARVCWVRRKSVVHNTWFIE